MLFINHNNTNPYFNHAAEEYVLTSFEDECFMLWRNDPCILIGKNQNAFAEINEPYVNSNNIKVVRRLTGGGAVFNDLGNINFTFISKSNTDVYENFKKFTAPILRSLQALGVDATFSGRNDLVIDGKKFSGNAQYYYKDKVLHHGTLLFSSSMNNLTQALKVNPLKIKSKGVASIRSRVTNISDYLNNNMDVLTFKNYVVDFVMKEFNETMLYTFNDKDLSIIDTIIKNRFSQYEWNFGKLNYYTHSKEKRFNGGTLEVNLNIENKIIKDFKIYGDFFFTKNIKDLETLLINKEYNLSTIKSIFKSINVTDYIHNINNDDLIELIF